MLDHVSISVSDTAQAERFYDAVMAALGVMKVGSSETWIGYGERCDQCSSCGLTICSRTWSGNKPLKEGGPKSVCLAA
jgi:catechol 2,3-dioxygenase-like lactoylglutathione lyase family enzyme